MPWGSDASQPYTGQGPPGWASPTARGQAAIEKTLAAAAGMPRATLIPYPDDDPGSDKLAPLRADMRTARGDALFVSTRVGGHGAGASAQPQRDWAANFSSSPGRTMSVIIKLEHILGRQSFGVHTRRGPAAYPEPKGPRYLFRWHQVPQVGLRQTCPATGTSTRPEAA